MPKVCSVENTEVSTNGAGKLRIHMEENEPRAFSLTLQKNHLEGDFEKLNLRSAILKLLEEKSTGNMS